MPMYNSQGLIFLSFREFYCQLHLHITTRFVFVSAKIRKNERSAKISDCKKWYLIHIKIMHIVRSRKFN